MFSWLNGRTERRAALWLALVALALLGTTACGESEEDEPYLPTGEGRQGGSGGGGGSNNNGEDSNNGEAPTVLSAGELIYLRDNNGGTDVLYPSGQSALELARLVDEAGADVQVSPGDLAIGHDGARLFYSSGGSLWSSAVDGSQVKLEASGRGVVSRPQVTSDGGAVIFIGGDGLYRLTLSDGQVSNLNVSLASCQRWVDLSLQGTAEAWAVRADCTQALDGGLVEVRFATGSATPVVTATELSPEAEILAVASPAGSDQVYFWASGQLDIDGDASPDSEDRQALYSYNSRQGVLSADPFVFANPQAYGRGLAVLGNDQVVVDLVQPNNQAESGLYVLSPGAGTFQALQLGTDLSSPTTR